MLTAGLVGRLGVLLVPAWSGSTRCRPFTVRRANLAPLDVFTIQRLQHHGRTESLIIDGGTVTWRPVVDD